jgi:hypothetical protein
VRDYLAPFRQTVGVPAPPPRLPKPGKVASWIMTRPGALRAEDQAGLDAILAASLELAACTEHVRVVSVITPRMAMQTVNLSSPGCVAQ